MTGILTARHYITDKAQILFGLLYLDLVEWQSSRSLSGFCFFTDSYKSFVHTRYKSNILVYASFDERFENFESFKIVFREDSHSIIVSSKEFCTVSISYRLNGFCLFTFPVLLVVVQNPMIEKIG